jgi:hypothetical protein
MEERERCFCLFCPGHNTRQKENNPIVYKKNVESPTDEKRERRETFFEGLLIWKEEGTWELR